MKDVVINNLFFIIGNPRSGTTLLRLMLNNHPAITIPPECGFMLWLAERFDSKNFEDNAVRNHFLAELSQTRKFETWNINLMQLRNFIDEHHPVTYQDASLLVYLFYALSKNKKPMLIGDKNNFYINRIDQIRRMFPNAKLIFIVRDGRDVACSYKELAVKKIDSIYAPQLPFEIDKIAQEWSANNSLLIREIKKNGVILVKYEDLISNPEMVLRDLCGFLGLLYDSQMMEYHTRNESEQQEPIEFLQWKEKTLQAPDPSNAGKFKWLLTPQEINQFNKIAGNILSYFAYEV